MGRFIITEEEKSYIQSLYNLSEQTQNHTVKEIQELLHKYGYGEECGPADGRYGPKTANALSLYLADKKAGTLRKPQQSTTNTDDQSNTASDSAEATTPEDKAVERVEQQLANSDANTVEDQIKQLEAASGAQPTKDQCVRLIAAASVGIKKGVQLKQDQLNTLGQCYNSYNFVGGGSGKVKRHYKLKGKGN